LVLMNSAGLIQKGYLPSQEASDPGLLVVRPPSGPPGFVADLVTNVLIFYLERSVGRYTFPELPSPYVLGSLQDFN